MLSPVLLLLVMDPLLQGLEANHLDPLLRNTVFAYADGIGRLLFSPKVL